MSSNITVLYDLFLKAKGQSKQEATRKLVTPSVKGVMKKDVFDLLEKELKKAVESRFVKPTPVQERVIPAILEGKDVLTISETGSGKTEAVMLPIFDLWLRDGPEPISILYITPLRSLNRDLLKRILWWSEKLNFDVSVRHGDTTNYERKMQAENPPDMMIVTPETLQAVLTGKVMREHLRNVRYIVVDEVHELVSSKRGIQLSVGLERLKELIRATGNEEPRILGISATVGSPEKVMNFLASTKRTRQTEIINTAGSGRVAVTVESPRERKGDGELGSRMLIGPGTAARVRRINELIRGKKSTLTFTNTREFAEILSSRMKAFDRLTPVETHHSSLSKDVRIKAEEGFKSGGIKSLICTSSLELGIDIGLIDFVIQYQSPRQVAKFLQRVGRAGHSLDRVSEGVIIASEVDDCFEAAVIARHAVNGMIEPTGIYLKSWDVLAHQIVGLAIDEYKIPLDKAYGITRRAYPYENMTKDEFLDVCKTLERLRMLWLDGATSEIILKRRRPAWEYYYNNLSTIPNIKNYQIFDTITNKPVGTLDSEFVALHGTPGSSFITKGQAWRVLEIQDARNRIYVEPLSGIEASIPAWEGELIPVPWDVAQEVGRLRREIAAMIKSGKKGKQVTARLSRDYPVTSDIASTMYETVRKQLEWGTVPDDKTILVEHFRADDETCVVIHTCWGSLVNETVGRTLSTLMTAKYSSVGLQTDPYRIIFTLPTGYNPMWEEVVNFLRELRPENIPVIIRLSLPNTELFRWRFLHVAKRFGIISRDADYGKGYLRKIVESYAGTPPHREAINEMEQEKLDVPKAMEVMKKFHGGAIKLKVDAGLSPLGKLGVNRKYEIVASEKPEEEIFNAFRERLLGTGVGLVCMQCGKWATIRHMRELPEKIVCPRCAARLIGVAPSKRLIEAQNLVTKFRGNKPLTDRETKWIDDMMNSATLVLSSGKDAITALAGRGIGPRTAGRILATYQKGDDLLKEILRAERLYAKNKRFWRD
jgi:ATP-dependent Lhr-like helicase